MATIHFVRTEILSGEYWHLRKVDNWPEQRGLLELILQEYLVVSGEIGASMVTVNEALKKLRDELEEDGHTIVYHETDLESD
jgi:hypothetical protein